MDICDKIINAYEEGWLIHCGIIQSMDIVELAYYFGLLPTPNIYRTITSIQAYAVAKRILHRGLAYDFEIMAEIEAETLAKEFLNCFDEKNGQYYTNGSYYFESKCNSWCAATNATFDTGILVIDASKAGCLWAEDED